MHAINVWLTVKEVGRVDTIRGLLAQAARKSRQEPGCLRFDVYHSQSDERRFLLVEHWESEAALNTHRQGEAYTTIYQPRILPHVEREGHVVTLLE